MQNQENKERLLDLAVVGAGPSGLAYGLGAIDSSENKPAMKVLERAHQAGGFVRSMVDGPYLIETGPYGYLDKHPELGELVRLVGLENQARSPLPSVARRRFVVARGKLRKIPIGPGSFLSSRILPLSAKVRLLREPWCPPPPKGVDETVTDFAVRHLGVKAAEALVVPMFLGIYAGDPDKASLASSFPRMAELEQKWQSLFRALWALRKKVKDSGQGVGAPRGQQTSFSGGLSTLIQAMAERLGGSLMTGAEVQRITGDGSSYRLILADERELSARQVVLAIPARVLARVASRLDPEITELAARIPYVSVAVVHTAHRLTSGAVGRKIHRRTTGTGFLIPRSEHKDGLLGTVFVSSLFNEACPQDEILLRSVLGGRLHPEVMEWSDEKLCASVASWHSRLLGVSEDPVFVRVDRYPDALPQYDVGHGQILAKLDRCMERWPGLSYTGNAFRGIGLADCLAANFQKGRAFKPGPSAET